MKQIVALVSSVVMCCVLLPASVYAQTVKAEFPSKTIKIIVPYVPGGSTDLLARTLGNAVAEKLKQPVIVATNG